MRRRVRRVGTRPGRQVVHYFGAALCAWIALACGPTSPEGVGAPTAPASQPAARPTELPVVLFLGTSLTAGYGLPSEDAFPAVVQRRIDEATLGYRVVNAGVSGDTSAGGLRRIEWLLRLPVAVLVLELGANDMLRGHGIDAMHDNLRTIIERTRKTHPDTRFVVAGMRAAPNLGAAYARQFDAAFPALAEQYDAALIPFLLEGVATVRRLNQPDGIHPTAEGHRILADTVWATLEPLLRSD